MVRRRSSDPSRRRKPLARDGLRAETLGWEPWPGISQRVVPSSSTAEECGSGRLWVSPGYASRGKWQPAHCASDAQVSEETGPKSSYGYTKTLKGPPPSGGQR
jgi:hypothetical protein